LPTNTSATKRTNPPLSSELLAFFARAVAKTVRPEQNPPNRPKGVGGYFSHHGISKLGTFIERQIMQITLETTIGTVQFNCWGQSIHVSTQQESLPELEIDIWDHSAQRMRIESSIDEVFLEVANKLNEHFPGFQVASLLVNVAPLEKLMESVLIKAYASAMARQ
jgi:hypothetical protein